MPRAACASGCDDGNIQAIGDGTGQVAVEARSRAVAVHGSEENFPRTARFGFHSPVQGVSSGRIAAAVSESLPGTIVAPGINRDDHGLRSEVFGDFGDQSRSCKGGGVDADLVGSRREDGGGILQCANTSPYSEGNKELPRGAADGVEQRRTALMRGGDIEENDLVGTGFGVALRQLCGVTGVAQID